MSGILKFISTTNNNLIGLELFGMAAFALSFFTPAILTKIYFNSFSKGFMIFVLNFSLAVVRTKAALAALLRIDPPPSGAGVQREQASTSGMRSTNRYEIALALALFVFSCARGAVEQHRGGPLACLLRHALPLRDSDGIQVWLNDLHKAPQHRQRQHARHVRLDPHRQGPLRGGRRDKPEGLLGFLQGPAGEQGGGARHDKEGGDHTRPT